MLGFLGATDLHQDVPHYRIDHYVKDSVGHPVPLGHPPLHFNLLAVVSPGLLDHCLVIPLPIEEPLEILARAIPLQEFHALCSVQQVVGLPHIE